MRYAGSGPFTRFPSRFERGRAVRSPEKQLRGTCRVVEGTRLRINGLDVELAGIVSPQPGDPFHKEAGLLLERLCESGEVVADVVGVSPAGEVRVVCRTQKGADLAAELLRHGYVLAEHAARKTEAAPRDRAPRQYQSAAEQLAQARERRSAQKSRFKVDG